jgi:hypothetical protein
VFFFALYVHDFSFSLTEVLKIKTTDNLQPLRTTPPTITTTITARKDGFV